MASLYTATDTAVNRVCRVGLELRCVLTGPVLGKALLSALHAPALNRYAAILPVWRPECHLSTDYSDDRSVNSSRLVGDAANVVPKPDN